MYKGHLSIEELDELSQQKGPAENQSHVESCPQCKSLLEKCQAVNAKLEKLASVHIGARNAMNCPDERIWFNVVGGTLPEAETLELVQHAAECQSCGKKLATATRMFEDELSPEEEETLASLPSSNVNVQGELAERLAQAADERPRSAIIKPKRRFWRPLSYAFATTAALALIAFFSLSSLTDTFLARGYTERGTLEYRIAKADPPKEGSRGGLEEKERPVSLVMADLLIRTRLAIRPKSPYWLGEKGRLELIEGRSSALETLRTAHTLDPNSKAITIDLASAMVAHFSGHGTTTELFEAQEVLLSILPPDPNDIEALKLDSDNLNAVYNLAIVYEMIGSFDQAAKEWELYLQLDGASPWAEEARRKLKNLRHQKKGKSPPTAGASVSEWEAYLNSGEANASEATLDVALILWLPSRNAKSTEFDRVLFDLAARLEGQHGDHWLSDLLEAVPSGRHVEALRHLRNAIGLNAVGDFDSASREATAAQLIFKSVGNIPGLIRAQLEQVYSYQRETAGEKCLEAANNIETSARAEKFGWIQIQLYLDKATCFNELGRLQEAKTSSDQGIDLANTFDYKIALSRAIGISSSQATARGDHALALGQDVEGLRRCWSNWCPAERLFQFYSDITFNAESLGLWRVTYDAGNQVVRAIAPSSHKELEAVARYRVANAAVTLGKRSEALEEVRQANELFSVLPKNDMTLRYRTYAIVGLAKAEFNTGAENDALTLLQRSAAESRPSEDRLFARTFFQLSGDLASRTGRLQDAELAYDDAVEIAESGLSGLESWRDKLNWVRENASSYRKLVQLRLQRSDPAAALEIWEAYKAAMVRSSPISEQLPRQKNYVTELHQVSLPTSYEVENARSQITSSQAVITYAALSNVIAAWILDRNGLAAISLPIVPDDLFKLVRQFVVECSDPDSDLKQLTIHANELYHILVAPFKDHLSHVDTLIIETDGDLDALPFEALSTDLGTYLIEEMAIVYSPGIVFRKHLRPLRPITSLDRVVAVGSPALAKIWQNLLPPLPSAKEEAERVAANFPNSSLFIGADASYHSVEIALRRATVFHFAGHSIHTSSGIGLLFTPDPSEPPTKNGLFVFGDLDDHTMENLKLVVLSACATAYGDQTINQVLDPLFHAGVPQVVATRWNIDSAATPVFIRYFYEQIISGASEISFRRAAIFVLKQPATRRPYFWAAFKLVGVM